MGFTQTGSVLSGAVLPIRSGVAGKVKQVAGQVSLQGVACPAARTCIAVGFSTAQFGGGVLDVITNGVPGAPRTVPGMGQLLAVACPSASDCVAVGTLANSNRTGVITFTNGKPGPAQPVDGPASFETDGGLSAVVCATSTRCVAIGGGGSGGQGRGVVVPIRNGSPGPVELPLPPTSQFSGISCPTSTRCLTVGRYAADWRTGPFYNVSLPISATGRPGTARRKSTDKYSLQSIACPSATDCVYGGASTVNTYHHVGVGVLATGYP